MEKSYHNSYRQLTILDNRNFYTISYHSPAKDIDGGFTVMVHENGSWAIFDSNNQNAEDYLDDVLDFITRVQYTSGIGV